MSRYIYMPAEAAVSVPTQIEESLKAEWSFFPFSAFLKEREVNSTARANITPAAKVIMSGK